ncbi:MAG: hypothetical protein JJ971_14250 [Balneolaceae bacterium]|nr:hypothetical protein [Balneolaceae bacterium]MBO6547563.1 hypothetical protein [Balneolaceae bacterium]MBO6648074.1 hypothetical protein [Balneolaceae bacterium]
MYLFIENFIPLGCSILIVIGAYFFIKEKTVKILLLVSFLVLLVFYTAVFYFLHTGTLFFFDVYDWNDLNFASTHLANEYYLHILGLIIYQTLSAILIYKRFISNKKVNA